MLTLYDDRLLPGTESQMSSRRSATIPVTTVPVAVHTWSAIPFVENLIHLGHRVLWYAADQYRDTVRQSGATHLPFTACPPGAQVQTPPAVGRRRGLADLQHVGTLYRILFARPAHARCKDLPALCAERRVDLDTPPFGSGLLPRSGLPSRNRNRTVRGASDRLLFRDAAARLRRAHRQLGYPAPAGPLVATNTSPHLHLQCASTGFEFPRREPAAGLRRVGPVRHQRPAGWREPDWRARLSQAPVVLVSPGTMRPDVTELLLPAMRGLADDGSQILLTHSQQDDPTVLRPTSETVITERFVPYEPLLPHVDVFITNGGYASVVWALAHGIPIVQARVNQEKADIGACLARLEAAINLGTSRPGPTAIRAAVRSDCSARYRQAAATLAPELAPLDAERDGAAAIDELLQDCR